MMKYSLFVAFFVIMLFTGCNNRNDLILGTWEMKYSYVNGVREKEDVPLTLVISNDGTFRQVVNYTAFIEDAKGTWTLNIKTNELILVYSHTSTVASWQVEIINPNLLKLKYKIPGFVVEREYTKQYDVQEPVK